MVLMMMVADEAPERQDFVVFKSPHYFIACMTFLKVYVLPRAVLINVHLLCNGMTQDRIDFSFK